MLAIVALGMIVVLGAAALAIETGRLFLERRDAQGAADHAAATAAFAYCSGGSEASAISAGQAAAARNGYDNDGTTNTVTVTHLTGNQFRAVVDSTIDATLGHVLGFNAYDVGTEAGADCTGTGGEGPGAVLAGGDDCNRDFGKNQFDLSGSNQVIVGGIHSNDNLHIGSSPNAFTVVGPPDDPVTYVTTLSPDPPSAGNTFQAGYPLRVGGKPWPAGFAPADAAGRFATYKAAAQASPTDNLFYISGDLTSLTANGLYYVAGKIDIGSVSGNLSVTLIAEGDIKLSVSSYNLSPFQDGLLLASNKPYTGIDRCDKVTVGMSGSAGLWTGIVWGPTGLIEVSGSANWTSKGALVGWAVRLNGSNLRLEFDPSLFPGPGTVFLME